MDDIEQLKTRVRKLELFIDTLNFSDRLIFSKTLQFQDGRNFQFGTGTGTKFGTGTNQKMGFFNKAPVAQQTTITTPSGGGTVDTQARSSIAEIKTVLTNLGLTA